MRWRMIAGALLLSACSGVAWNTEVATTEASRTAMALSVVPGTTTETSFTTRWGKPTQSIRDGGQTEYVYRNMRNPPGWFHPQFGDSQNYVIVTFHYGLATAVRTSDGIDCRGTFAPRPPNHAYDNPSTVRLVGRCAPHLSPEEAARKGPIARSWDALKETWNDITSGDPATSGTSETTSAAASPKRPGVAEDGYKGVSALPK